VAQLGPEFGEDHHDAANRFFDGQRLAVWPEEEESE